MSDNWPRYNWERWKRDEAKRLGLRLIVSAPAKRLNDATPEEWDRAVRELRQQQREFEAELVELEKLYPPDPSAA